jgi:hypothetical protein
MSSARVKSGLNAALSMALLFAALHAAADVKGRVGVSLQDTPTAWLGQQVNIYLDLETTGFSFADIHFSLPQVSGAILMQTDTSTIKLSDTRNGEPWQVLRYPLVLYPQKTGMVTVPPLTVRFTAVAAFGTEPRSFDLRTESLTLTIRRPPGTTAGTPVVTTTTFELSYRRNPEAVSLRTGDALQLSITRRAKGVSGMFLDPIRFPVMDGVAAYPEAPQIEDRVDRGALTGERTDELAWVFEKPGHYEFPELRFQWWDPATRRLKQSIVPALAVEVSAGPLGTGTGPAQAARGPSVRWAGIALAVALIGATAWAAYRWRGPKRSRPATSSFDALTGACGENDARLAYRALSAWINEQSPRSPAWTPSEFARWTGNARLADAVLGLQRHLIEDPQTWQGSRLLEAIRAIATNSKGGGDGSKRYHGLPELNPRLRFQSHA